MTEWDILGKDIEWGQHLANERPEKGAISLSELTPFKLKRTPQRLPQSNQAVP